MQRDYKKFTRKHSYLNESKWKEQLRGGLWQNKTKEEEAINKQ